jgi:hypothetical protein
MASSSSPAVRRSSRSRQKLTTIYDAAAVELEEKERSRAAAGKGEESDGDDAAGGSE